MRDKVKVQPNSTVWLGKKSLDEGFIGEVPRLANFFTQTLVRPGTSLADVKDSLETIIRDVDGRIREFGEDTPL